MLRSVLAVVAGFFFIGFLAFGADALMRSALPGVYSPSGRVDSVPVLLLVMGYVFVFAVAGCYLTARLAPRRPMLHALTLGALGLAFNVVGTIMMWETAPVWFHAVSLLLVMPAAWLGGWLRETQRLAQPRIA